LLYSSLFLCPCLALSPPPHLSLSLFNPPHPFLPISVIPYPLSIFSLLPPSLSPSLLSSIRLLSQLDETERACDEFWGTHQAKLEQCLQLRHFEHNFREMRCLLDQVAERLTVFSEVGVNPAHADHIFRELNSHEERVLVSKHTH
uniref:Uncharacterized protein n=1 Tax=Hucho hucho TaxID=62062 RepID=A0A4W5L631_9TELE